MPLTTAQRLVEAEEALHQLLTGTKAVSMSYEGRTVTFTQANIEELRKYIADLKAQIAAASGVCSRRPFGVSW